ncbi:hypothetical protein SRHO_G00079490 [Serrasalmus rhombeus]
MLALTWLGPLLNSFLLSPKSHGALAWATSLWEQNSPDIASGESFVKALWATFHNPIGGGEAAPHLQALTEGARLVADYAIKFHTLATESG